MKTMLRIDSAEYQGLTRILVRKKEFGQQKINFKDCFNLQKVNI